MLRQTPNRRHRWLAPANSDLESSYESRPGYHPVEVHTQAGPTQVSLHNQAVEALACARTRQSGSDVACGTSKGRFSERQRCRSPKRYTTAVSYTHLRAHET